VFDLFKGHPAIWIGRSRERDVLKLSKGHLAVVIELARTFRSFMESYTSNDREGARKFYSEIFELERRADGEKERIISEISRGPFHPMDREDLLRLILTMDDIASNLKSAARKLLHSDPSAVPDGIKGGLIKLGEMVMEIVERLERALEALIQGSRDTLRLADAVERMEEEIDEFRSTLIADILRWGDESGRISVLLMLKEAVENLENASDRAEDVADVIRGIVATRL